MKGIVCASVLGFFSQIYSENISKTPKLPLEQIIGGLFITVPSKEIIRDYNIGGIIYFQIENGTLNKTQEEMKLLSDEYKLESKRVLESNKLLVAIDHEGASINRIPSIAKLDNPSDVGGKYEQATTSHEKKQILLEFSATWRMQAEILKSIGVNYLFGPSIDITNSSSFDQSKRSYSSNEETVKLFSEVVIKQTRKQGILSCIKHYPSIYNGKNMNNDEGWTDTHKQMGYVYDKDIYDKELRTIREILFKTSLDFSNQTFSNSIMIGHLIDAYTKKEIYKSPNIIRKLKENLSTGFIISDDIGLFLYHEYYDYTVDILSNDCKEMITSGVDMIIQSDIEMVPKIIRDLAKKATKDKKFKDRIYDAYSRVQTAKSYISD